MFRRNYKTSQMKYFSHRTAFAVHRKNYHKLGGCIYVMFYDFVRLISHEMRFQHFYIENGQFLEIVFYMFFRFLSHAWYDSTEGKKVYSFGLSLASSPFQW